MKWTFCLKILCSCLIYIIYIPCCYAQFNLLQAAKIAVLDSEKYKLTPAKPYQKGAIWHPTSFDLTYAFDMTFHAFLGCQKKGAEGLAFVWQQEGLQAIGRDSTGFGYEGITPSLAVIMDNHANPPKEHFRYNTEHISLVKDGDLNKLVVGPTIANPSKKNDTTAACKHREIRILWDPSAPILQVFVDDKVRLVYRSNIVKKIFNNNPIVYWGFTAATGKRYNTHGISIVNYPDIPEPKESIPAIASSLTQTRPLETILGAALDSLSHSLGAKNFASKVTTDGLVPKNVAPKKQTTDSLSFPLVPKATIYQAVSPQNVPPTCYGAKDGSIQLKVKGTQQPYRFLWEDGNTQAHRKNLAAGKYAFTVFDKHGNSKTDTTHLLNPSPLTLQSITNFPDTADFNWKAIVKGGHPPYTQERGSILVMGNAEIKHTPTHVDILNADDVIHIDESEKLSKTNLIQANENQLITEIGFVIVTDESSCKAEYYLEPKTIDTSPIPVAANLTSELITNTNTITPIPIPIPISIVPVKPFVKSINQLVTKTNNEKVIITKISQTVLDKKTAPTLVKETVDKLAVSYTTRNIPDSLGERRVKTGKRVLVWKENVELFVWDSEEVDGDTISLYFNGDWILKEYPLRRKKKKLRIRVEPNADNYLILYAHNEGKRPPNTAALKISDGRRENKIGLSADMHNCDAINFKLKR